MTNDEVVKTLHPPYLESRQSKAQRELLALSTLHPPYLESRQSDDHANAETYIEPVPKQNKQ